MKGFREGAKGWLYGMTLKTDSRETMWVLSSVCQSLWWERECLPEQVGGNIKKGTGVRQQLGVLMRRAKSERARAEGETKIEENIVLEMQ